MGIRKTTSYKIGCFLDEFGSTPEKIVRQHSDSKTFREIFNLDLLTTPNGVAKWVVEQNADMEKLPDHPDFWQSRFAMMIRYYLEERDNNEINSPLLDVYMDSIVALDVEVLNLGKETIIDEKEDIA